MRSSNASPIAQSLTFESALSACDAAPEPRPPQPMRPTFKSSLAPAWTFRGMVSAASEPRAAAEDDSRNLRREEEAVIGALLEGRPQCSGRILLPQTAAGSRSY